ncbi:MAG: hypothetical protein NVS3B12_10090 [Acidimicrobiales bacterium]
MAADRSWASTLGLAWSKEEPGLVSTFTPAPEHRGPPGFLHGGLAAAVLDETMAALSITTDGWHSVTAKLELRYRTPVPLDGQPLRIEAWRDPTDERRSQKSRRVQKIHGRLLVADGSAAVEATGLFVRVDAESGDE